MPAGWTGTLIMRTMDVFYAFPSILLAIAICGLHGQRPVQLHHRAGGRVHPAHGARVGDRNDPGAEPRFRGGRARLRHAPRCRSSATTCWRTFWDPILVYATSLISVSIILSAGLSFLGLGVTPPQAEWGLMLNSLRQAIYVQPYVAALPGLMIFVTSMCFNLMSDGVPQRHGCKAE